MTIGELIDALSRANPNTEVSFDFGNLSPTALDSWRGFYAEAALGWRNPVREGCDWSTVADLLQQLQEALDGRTYTGWKGGEYRYTRDTRLHIDNPGCCTDTDLVRAEVDEFWVTLHTAKGA